MYNIYIHYPNGESELCGSAPDMGTAQDIILDMALEDEYFRNRGVPVPKMTYTIEAS